MYETQGHCAEAGGLGVLELKDHLPFTLRRIYWLHGTPAGQVRGLHAHKTLEQLILVLTGSVSLTLDDGVKRWEIELREGSPGVHVTPGTWRELHGFTPGTVVLVLASEHYDSADYIHDYEEFLDWKRV